MKKILLTKRDNEIIDFLKEYKCATTSTIAKIFFNGSIRPCSRRLKNLRDNGFIKSSQEYVSMEQIHYINKKPSQLKHSCIVSRIIGELCSRDIKILKSKIEFKMGSIRSDLMVVINKDNKNYIYLIEVCNTKKFDLNKYEKIRKTNMYKEYFPIFPNILVISDKHVDKSNKFNIKVFNLDLDNFNL